MNKSDIVKTVIAGSFVIGSIIITNLVIREYDKANEEIDRLNDKINDILGNKIDDLSNKKKSDFKHKLVKTEIVGNNKIKYYDNGMSVIQFNVEKGA